MRDLVGFGREPSYLAWRRVVIDLHVEDFAFTLSRIKCDVDQVTDMATVSLIVTEIGTDVKTRQTYAYGLHVGCRSLSIADIAAS